MKRDTCNSIDENEYPVRWSHREAVAGGNRPVDQGNPSRSWAQKRLFFRQAPPVGNRYSAGERTETS